jgi:inner membrane protein
LLLAREQPREHKLLIVAATTLGWATHGLLDAFTSYGTMLWWPFSSARVAWNWISVIDPIYSLILALGVFFCAKASPRVVVERPASRDPRKLAWLALFASSLYLGLCGVQQRRALAAQAKIAELRQHKIVRGSVQPLLLTNLLWRSMYEAGDGRIWIDALSVPWRGQIGHHGGGARPKVEAPTKLDDPRDRDLARFAWFADGWVYAAPELSGADPVYCDARYSLQPARFVAVFCVAIGPDGASELIQRRPPLRSRTADEARSPGACVAAPRCGSARSARARAAAPRWWDSDRWRSDRGPAWRARSRAPARDRRSRPARSRA